MSTLYGLIENTSGNLVAISTTVFDPNMMPNGNASVTVVSNVPRPAYVQGDLFSNKVHHYDTGNAIWTILQ